jgi:hypothetical protein
VKAKATQILSLATFGEMVTIKKASDAIFLTCYFYKFNFMKSLPAWEKREEMIPNDLNISKDIQL